MAARAPMGPEPGDTTMARDAGLRRYLGYYMKRGMNVVQADLNATLKPLGLRMITFSTLVVASDNPGLRQAQLANFLSIERPNLVAIIEELVQRGLLTRERVKTDRRAYAIALTPEGRTLLDKAKKAIEAHERRVFADFSEDDQTHLVRLMSKLVRQGSGDPS